MVEGGREQARGGPQNLVGSHGKIFLKGPYKGLLDYYII